MDDAKLEEGRLQKVVNYNPSHSTTISGQALQPHSTQYVHASSDLPLAYDLGDTGRFAGIPRSVYEDLVRSLVRVVKEELSHAVFSEELNHPEKAAVTGSRDLDLRPLPDFNSNTSVNGDDHVATGSANDGMPESPSPALGGGFPQAGEAMEERLHTDGESRTFWTSCASGPFEIIEVWVDHAIEHENTIRRRFREQWRTERRFDHITDSWKTLWEHKAGIDRGIFQWACDDAKRQNLQLDLVDALILGRLLEQHEKVDWMTRKDFRVISCWISLIGLRLNDLYRSQELTRVEYGAKSVHGVSPMTQVEVLIECLWACHASDNVEVSRVLERCYHRRVLTQPSFRDAPDYKTSKPIVARHIYAIRAALYVVNLLYTHEVPEVRLYEDIDQVWSTRVKELEFQMRKESKKSGLGVGGGLFFSVDDFNICDLKRLGHIHIRWTSHWDEHLKLDVGDNLHILYLYWFHPNLSSYLPVGCMYGELSEADRVGRAHEIFRTLCLLLGTTTSNRRLRRIYGNLEAPRWLSLLADSSINTWSAEQEAHELPSSSPPLARFNLSRKDGSNEFCAETSYHLVTCTSESKKSSDKKMAYSHYPYYEHRLRELRAYMDSQQPKGLKALWKDSRNSNAYYTFWFVIYFGGLTVFLGICALGVAIAQAWAQFQSRPLLRPER